MHSWKNCRSKHSTLCLLLLPTLELICLKHIVHGTLNHGHAYPGNNMLGRAACRQTVSALQLKVSNCKQVEVIVVELGHAGEVGSFDAADLVVGVSLVCKLVEELPVVAGAVFSFDGASVEAL